MDAPKNTGQEATRESCVSAEANSAQQDTMDYLQDLLDDAGDCANDDASIKANTENTVADKVVASAAQKSEHAAAPVQSARLTEDEVIFPGEADQESEEKEGGEVRTIQTRETIVLDAIINIKCIQEIAGDLQRDWTHLEQLTVDGSAVESIDTAGLQLLLGAMNAAKKSHVQIEWCEVSPELLELATLVGLDTALGIENIS